jgi:hypothetical protein
MMVKDSFVGPVLTRPSFHPDEIGSKVKFTGSTQNLHVDPAV